MILSAGARALAQISLDRHDLEQQLVALVHWVRKHPPSRLLSRGVESRKVTA